MNIVEQLMAVLVTAVALVFVCGIVFANMNRPAPKIQPPNPEDGKFWVKPVIIQARQHIGANSKIALDYGDGDHEVIEVESGDWIVTDPDGFTCVFSDETFRRAHEPADAVARQAWA